MKLRVAIVQINSILGEIDTNKRSILNLLRHVKKDIDLIVLSELALTGYNYTSPSHINPFLDSNQQSLSTAFAQKLSRDYKCFTVIGYPEKEGGTIYNSCKMINPLGKEVYNYHKTFLYETDEVWGCSENPSKEFEPIDVILNKEFYIGKEEDKDESKYTKTTINFGICMDLNPYKFEAPFNKYEFAMSCYQNKSNLIICPMAWLSPYSPSLDKETSKHQTVQKASHINEKLIQSPQFNMCESDNQPFESKTSFIPQLPDFSTVNYHILRFFPLMNHPYNDLPKQEKVTVLTCNRIGVESDIVYGGSSSIFQFRNVEGSDSIDYTNPAVDLKGFLSQGAEGVLYRELEI